jgi:hypothetical protein
MMAQENLRTAGMSIGDRLSPISEVVPVIVTVPAFIDIRSHNLGLPQRGDPCWVPGTPNSLSGICEKATDDPDHGVILVRTKGVYLLPVWYDPATDIGFVTIGARVGIDGINFRLVINKAPDSIAFGIVLGPWNQSPPYHPIQPDPNVAQFLNLFVSVGELNMDLASPPIP